MCLIPRAESCADDVSQERVVERAHTCSEHRVTQSVGEGGKKAKKKEREEGRKTAAAPVCVLHGGC